MKKYLFLIPALWLFWACEEEATPQTIDELTVEAFLYAGQTLDSVKFWKIIPFDATEAPAYPNDLVPVVVDENGQAYPLQLMGEEGVYGNSDLLIEAEKTYTIEVIYHDKTISASTYVPGQPLRLELSDSTIYRKQINDFTDIQDMQIPDPIEITWQAEAGAYYFVQVKNIENDPDAVNALFEEEGIELPDFLTEPSSNSYYTINVFREITHFGTYEVRVYRVNPEYVALYEDNSSGAGALNEIRTNVQNGYGIFTGVNSTRIYFEVKKL
ncbi:MAG TPA: DUF4249 family protein [Saprospiraceae bacterium]|nr:DUF4249 family protein [Saprospiraceae bacterium]HMQ83539.1 DUF4249 family protein [Saprospiraceae bacterium]